jgi:hypothetical protein
VYLAREREQFGVYAQQFPPPCRDSGTPTERTQKRARR